MVYISGYASLDVRSNNKKPDQAVYFIILKDFAVSL